jgi:hypothetical protein
LHLSILTLNGTEFFYVRVIKTRNEIRYYSGRAGLAFGRVTPIQWRNAIKLLYGLFRVLRAARGTGVIGSASVQVLTLCPETQVTGAPPSSLHGCP